MKIPAGLYTRALLFLLLADLLLVLLVIFVPALAPAPLPNALFNALLAARLLVGTWPAFSASASRFIGFEGLLCFVLSLFLGLKTQACVSAIQVGMCLCRLKLRLDQSLLVVEDGIT